MTLELNLGPNPKPNHAPNPSQVAVGSLVGGASAIVWYIFYCQVRARARDRNRDRARARDS